jgi:hypothetical protein
MTIREAFAKQLDGDKPLTQDYFDLKEEDRYKPHPYIDGLPPWTDETWEAFKKNRLKTSLGTMKQVGDRILWAIVIEDATTRRVHDFVDRELDTIEATFAVVEADRTIPVLIKKS